MFEQDQNKFLENALQNVKNSSIKMKNSIDRNDMRSTLKNASEMIKIIISFLHQFSMN